MVYKTQQLLEEKKELGQTRFPVTFFFKLVKFSIVQLVSPFSALKVILIYVQGCEKRNLKHTFMDLMKNSPEKLNFINLDKQPSIELAVEPRVSIAFKPRQMLVAELQNPALSDLILGQTCMALTLELETLFLEALNTTKIDPITSKVRFVKGLANYIKQ